MGFMTTSRVITRLLPLSGSEDAFDKAQRFRTFVGASLLNKQSLISERAVLRFICDHVDSELAASTHSSISKLESLLFAAVNGSAYDKSIEIAAANAITVLNISSFD